MAVIVTWSNHAAYQFMKKQLELSSDSVKVLLMRQGFVFNRDDHAKRANIKTNSGAISISFVAGTKKITRGTGSFLADGFVVGNKITTDASLNPGPFTSTNVIALEITVSEALTTEGPVTKTVTSNDELATGSGYTQDTKTLTTKTVTEDDTNNRSEMSADNVVWAASGGSIGPTPGAIFMDDTDTDKTILAYMDFGGDQQAPSGQNFTIISPKLRLNT